MKNNALLCLLFQLFLVKMVAPMRGGEHKGKGKGVADEGAGTSLQNQDIRTSDFNGRIEPAGASKEKYKVHILSEFYDNVVVRDEQRTHELTTGHQFTVPFLLHQKKQKQSSKIQEKFQSILKKCPPWREVFRGQWKSWNSKECECQECKNKKGVKKLTIVVETQLPHGKMAERSWTIWYPDFSLHYQFHFGAVDGQNLSLKGKVVLPDWFELKADDEIEVMDMEEKVVFGKLPYDQWQPMNTLMTGSGQRFSNAYRLDIPLDSAELGKFLSDNLVKPRIKFVYRSDKMQKFVFSKAEHAKEIAEKNANSLEMAAESSGHGGNGVDDEEKLSPESHAHPKSTTDEHGISKTALNSECLICHDKFVEGEEMLRSKFCKHINHAHCITPWLKQRNRCPVKCDKLYGPFLDIHLEGPVFSNDHYSFEYLLMLYHLNPPPAAPEQQQTVPAGEGANAAANAAQNRGVEHAAAAAVEHEQEQQNNNVKPSSSNNNELRIEDFDEDFARAEHVEFMKQQTYVTMQQHSSTRVIRTGRRVTAIYLPPQPEQQFYKSLAISRLWALKVYGNWPVDTENEAKNTATAAGDGISSSGKDKEVVEEEQWLMARGHHGG